MKETYKLSELFSQSMNQQFENKHSISTDVSTFNKSKSSVLIKKLL